MKLVINLIQVRPEIKWWQTVRTKYKTDLYMNDPIPFPDITSMIELELEEDLFMEIGLGK